MVLSNDPIQYKKVPRPAEELFERFGCGHDRPGAIGIKKIIFYFLPPAVPAMTE